jgi:hypothetical protein
MHDLVRSIFQHRVAAALRLPSFAGDGLPERMRSTTFAFLGLTAAAGLALVAMFAQPGFPLLSPAPLPDQPSLGESVADAEKAAPVHGRASVPVRPERVRQAERAAAGGPLAQSPSGSPVRSAEAAPPAAEAPAPAAAPETSGGSDGGGGAGVKPGGGSSPAPTAAPKPATAPVPPPVSSPEPSSPAPQPAASSPSVPEPAAPGNSSSASAAAHASERGVEASTSSAPAPSPSASTSAVAPESSASPGNGNGLAKGQSK